jgi:hypothetical protein
MRRRIRFQIGTLLALTFLLATSTAAQQSASVFDHGRFDRLLAEHVTPSGLVDYDAFAASDGFDTYLGSLAGVDMASLPQSERLALWLNAYNAYTIELINRNDERESIRNINKTLGFLRGKGPWSERFADVAGYTYTLDEIEHEVIRPRFGEPRIHFALVCAAVGCPPLRQEAYTGRDLDEQLDEQARAFLNQHTDKNRIDVATRTVYLSRIFDWYREDFPDGREGLGRYLAQFIPEGPGRALLESGDFEVRFTDYDWSLNAAP